MKLKGAIGLALLAILAVAVPPADAASTRAEYIAQADSICQTFVGPESAAYRGYSRSSKRMAHLSGHGSLKAWLNATRRTSKTLMAYTQIDQNLNDQLATLSPSAADAGTVGAWLNYRKQADAFGASAARALNRPVPQIGKYFKAGRQANASGAAAQRVIDGFGFLVCGVSV